MIHFRSQINTLNLTQERANDAGIDDCLCLCQPDENAQTHCTDLLSLSFSFPDQQDQKKVKYRKLIVEEYLPCTRLNECMQSEDDDSDDSLSEDST